MQKLDRLRKACIELSTVSFVPQNQFNPQSSVVASKIRALYEALTDLPDKSLPDSVAEYVYLPIHYLLQKDALGDRQTEYVLLVLGFLFQNCWNRSLKYEKASQYLSVVSYLIDPRGPGDKADATDYKSSSEVRTAGFQCLTTIIAGARDQGFADEFAENGLTAQMIGLALSTLKEDKYSQARQSALDLLNSILKYILVEPVFLSKVLPGVTSYLTQLTVGPFENVKASVKISGVNVLNTLLIGVFRCDNGSLSSEWLLQAAIQVGKALTKMSPLLRSSNPQIVETYLQLGIDLTEECLPTLEPCYEQLGDILLAGAGGGNESCFQTLKKAMLNEEFNKSIESKIRQYLESLPTFFNSHDTKDLLAALNGLSVCMKLSDDPLLLEMITHRIEESLPMPEQSSKDMQKNVGESLQSIQHITSSLQSPSTELTPITFEDLKIQGRVDNLVQQKLVKLLETIGSSSHGPTILNSLYQRLDNQGAITDVEILWIASNILRGACQKNGELAIADDFLEYSYNAIDNAASLLQKPKLPSYLAVNCYMIGEIASETADFRDQLVDGLFPLVDLLGHGNSVVIQQAQYALKKVARACGYDSVTDLVLSNKDYILDGISSRLNALDFTPSTSLTLSTLILLGGTDIIVYLDDIVASLFLILDKYHGYSRLVNSIFLVFSAMIHVMRTEYPRKIEPLKEGFVHITSLDEFYEELSKKPKVDDALLKAAEAAKLDDFHEKATTEETEIPKNDPDEPDIDAPMEETDEWDSPVEKSAYMIVDRIFEYCTKFLTHELPELRANILKLIYDCVPTLSTNAKLFLPRVHQIWPSVRARILEQESYVAEGSLGVVARLCEFSRDFVMTRFQELWSEIATSKSAIFKKRWPDFSPEGKFLRALCNCLSTVLTFSPVDFETFDSILWTTYPFFQFPYGHKLQYALEKINSDAVWYCLHETGTN